MKQLIFKKNRSIVVADNITELSPKQYIQLAGVLHNKQSQLKQALQALRILGNLSWWAFYRLPAEVKLNAIPYVDWIFKDLQITTQLMPQYKGYYGPISELDNLTLAEFHFAEKYFADYVAGNDHGLNLLIAVLYRPGKKNYNQLLNIDGDLRQPFNPNTTGYYAGIISKWPDAVKYAALMFYAGCRDKIADDNREIFTNPNPQTAAQDNGTGMYGVMRGLAGPKFGTLDMVEKMMLHTALLEINLIMDEQKRIEAESKK